MSALESPPYVEFFDFITSSPTLEQIYAFRMSDEAQAQVAALLEKNREGVLTAEEHTTLDEFIQLERIVRRLKINAYRKLQSHGTHS